MTFTDILTPELVATVLGLIFLFLKNKYESKRVFIEQLEVDVTAAVDKVYNEYVSTRKRLSEDGRLTDEEKAEARKLAVKSLLDIGRTHGIEYGKKYALPVLESLVQTYVLKRKG